jgi:beta-lactamase class A
MAAQAQAAGTPAAGQHGVDDGLYTQLAPMIAAHHGKVAIYARQLNSSHEIEINADTEVQTASVIKLAILYEAMEEVREGKAAWDEKLTLKPGEAVGGSGMLHFFDAPLTVTLKDVLTVNARVEALGLKHTHLYKKVMKPATGPMPADQPKFGLGKTTAREMAEIMEDIGECRLRPVHGWQNASGGLSFEAMDDADKAVCAVGLGMLKDQFYRETIPRYLPGGGDQTVASKTGSLNAVRNDVAIVAGKSGPMVISIFTWDNEDHGWTVDNAAEVLIARLGKAIVDAWSPDGLDAKGLVPGLGLGVGVGAGGGAGLGAGGGAGR